MCPWVGPHAPSFGRQLWGLPSRVEYLPPQGVLLPLVYGTTASPLWLELRGHSAWQVTPSWTVYRLACHRLLPWLRVTFAMVPDAACPGSDQQPWSTAPATGPVGRLGRPSVSDPWGVGSFLSPGRPTCLRCPGPPGSCSPVCPLGVLCCVCGVLGLRLLFTGVPARCVVLRVRCPGPPAPVHRCACSVCCVACAVSWASGSSSPVCPLGVLCCVCGVLGLRLLFTGVPARCVVLRVRCPGPPGSCSPVCPLGVLCCVCGVPGLPAPVHRCARSVCCVACAVSRASRLLFTGVLARCVVLRVRCPGPPAPVHRCACSVCCVACVVSWASWLLFTGVLARCVVLRVRCPGPPAPVHRCACSVCCVSCAASWASGSCSPVCLLGVLCCVCGVLGLQLLFTGVPARCVVLRVRRAGPPAPVHRCACSVCRVACAVSWASGSCSPVCPLGVLCCVCGVLGLRLLFTGVPARCVVLRVRCPGPPAPVHRCACSVCCVACAVSWASRLLFTGVLARCVVLRVRCPGPPAPVHRCACSVCCVACAASWASGSCSPVCLLGVLCCVCGVLGLRLLFTGVPARCVVLRVRRAGPPAPVHRCACSVCRVACAVSWASGSCSPVCPLGVLCCVCGVLGLRLLFTGVPARCVVLRARCPGPPAPVHRCACSVCCVACAVSRASRLLFTGVLARCVVLRVRCPGPPAPVHRCACSVCCVACAVSWASRLLFTGVLARCVVLRVRCPGPPAPVHRCACSVCCVACAASWASGSCSPVCLLGVLCCVCGVLGLPAPVHRCARSVCCVACAASWASGSCSPVCLLGVLCCVCGVLGLRLLFTGVLARCVVLRVRCPGPPGSCSPVCLLGVSCCVCGVLGLRLLFTGVPARCVVLRVRRPGPPAPVHRCACSVCCVACAVSWASGSCSPVGLLGVLCCVAVAVAAAVVA